VKLNRPDLAAYGLVALIVTAVTVLLVCGKEVPPLLTELGLILGGAGAGATIPRGNSAPADAPAPAVAPVVAPVVSGTYRTAVLPQDPPTGEFRMARH
jgi:hypothetical protein